MLAWVVSSLLLDAVGPLKHHQPHRSQLIAPVGGSCLCCTETWGLSQREGNAYETNGCREWGPLWVLNLLDQRKIATRFRHDHGDKTMSRTEVARCVSVAVASEYSLPRVLPTRSHRLKSVDRPRNCTWLPCFDCLCEDVRN